MLEVNEVIGKARSYLTEVMPDFANLEPEIEEMVRSQDGPEWKITFQAQTQSNPKDESLSAVLGRRRIVKVVEVDGSDGSLIAVRNPPPF